MELNGPISLVLPSGLLILTSPVNRMMHQQDNTIPVNQTRA